jgi:hypothetical protein
VRLGVEAKRQLGCVVLREPWRMALFDMAEGEEQEEEEEEDAEAESAEEGKASSTAPPQKELSLPAEEGKEGTDLSHAEDSGRSRHSVKSEWAPLSVFGLSSSAAGFSAAGGRALSRPAHASSAAGSTHSRHGIWAELLCSGFLCLADSGTERGACPHARAS